MTDPDAPSFRAAQSAHAQEVRSVRILTKALGCTQSQARQMVWLTAAQRAQVPNPNAGNRGAPLFQPPPVQRREAVLPAVPVAAVGAIEVPIPAVPAPPAILDGDWTTAFLCTEDGSVLKQVLTRDIP